MLTLVQHIRTRFNPSTFGDGVTGALTPPAQEPNESPEWFDRQGNPISTMEWIDLYEDPTYRAVGELDGIRVEWCGWHQGPQPWTSAPMIWRGTDGVAERFFSSEAAALAWMNRRASLNRTPA